MMDKIMIDLRILWIVIAVLWCLFDVSLPASILLFPLPFPSHWSWMAQIGHQLRLRNHQVYAVIRDSDEMRIDFETRDIQTLSYELPVKAQYKISAELENTVLTMLEKGPPSTWDMASMDMMEIIGRESKHLLRDKQLKNTMKMMKFDLAVVDGSPTSCYLFTIPYVFGIPYVSCTPSYVIRSMGLPLLPSFHMQPAGFPYSDQMTFPQRLMNTFFFIIEQQGSSYVFPGSPNNLLSMFEPGLQDVPIAVLAKNSRLFLIQQLQPLDWPKVTLPYVVNIGPLTMQPSKKLPYDLQWWIDQDLNSKLIVFSFGTLTSRLPFWLMSKYMDAFSQLDSKVIGRYTGIGCNDTAENVKMLPWIPQNDLLGHPSASVFVSHCGNGGLYEALYHGVPMLGLPLFGDHTYNCKRIEDKGYGIVLNFTMTTEQIVEAILEVINNPEYRKRTEKASAILKRDLQLPMEKAIYWIEYAIDFGTDHLRSPALDFRWYKYFCVDTLLTLFLIIVIIVYLVWRSVRYIWNTLFIPMYMYFINKQKQS